MSKFTVYTDKHGEFRWKFHAGNNCVVAKSGESYKKQEDCLASLHLLQKDIGGSTIGYQLRKGVLPTHAAPAGAASTAASSAASAHAPPATEPSPAVSPAQTFIANV